MRGKRIRYAPCATASDAISAKVESVSAFLVTFRASCRSSTTLSRPADGRNFGTHDPGHDETVHRQPAHRRRRRGGTCPPGCRRRPWAAVVVAPTRRVGTGRNRAGRPAGAPSSRGGPRDRGAFDRGCPPRARAFDGRRLLRPACGRRILAVRRRPAAQGGRPAFRWGRGAPTDGPMEAGPRLTPMEEHRCRSTEA
jgi:hypothetical protein